MNEDFFPFFESKQEIFGLWIKSNGNGWKSPCVSCQAHPLYKPRPVTPFELQNQAVAFETRRPPSPHQLATSRARPSGRGASPGHHDIVLPLALAEELPSRAITGHLGAEDEDTAASPQHHIPEPEKPKVRIPPAPYLFFASTRRNPPAAAPPPPSFDEQQPKHHRDPLCTATLF
jgi:hypothetical protein